ncbi:exodeoxyribonuclease V subunit alpha [Moraxella boevrei]|uniref:exodeoxyribonuclease V subunit alpha n=1 Tax=Faucicola boevrei TaxID=346665 RepID=UPI003734DDBB
MQNLSKKVENSLGLDSVAEFIALRQQQKQRLISKNSLSKVNQIIISNPTETENFTQLSDINIKQLFNLLDNALENGNTIFSLNCHVNDKQILQSWQNNGWLTQLDDASSQINTPIVVRKQGNQWTFWLQRQWFAEYQLATQLLAMTQREVRQLDFDNQPPIASSNSQDKNNEKIKTPNFLQQQAIDKANRYAFSIITGGPGTGKTFTVAELVKRLQHAHQQAQTNDPNLPALSIALTAPTGKAAQRMQESLQHTLKGEKISLENAKTLHRLLGIGQHGTPRYHKHNPLPDDLVIVDEASMLGLELASQLIDAIKPTARLILLGDANQLSAVDAGSVLADLCKIDALQDFRTELTETQRFDGNSKVGKLAQPIQKALNNNKPCDIDDLLEITDTLTAKNPEKIALLPAEKFQSPVTLYQLLAEPYQPFFALLIDWQKNGVNLTDENRKKLFDIFNQYRILTAGNHGILGKQALNEQLKKIFFQHGQQQSNYYFFHGLPIMITANDYHLGLFNGDIGICLWVNGALMVCFADKDKLVAINQLSPSVCEPAYAMTIHKSQGSEFDCVAVCVGQSHQRLLSQELIYTAITRSKNEVILVNEKQSLAMALQKKSHRHTGLALQF